MCFSASASFGAGILLSAISIATIKHVEKPSQLYFACIPIIFSIQQFSEGFLWLALTNSHYAYLQEEMTYLFLFFAQIVWPSWVPFAILKLEKEEKSRTILKILLGIGISVSLYLGYCLIAFDTGAQIIDYHISYKQSYPIIWGGNGDYLYIIATIVPTLISNIKQMWTLGIIIFISYVITALFYSDYVISVWCFFAALISIAVLLIILKIMNLTKNPQPIT